MDDNFHKVRIVERRSSPIVGLVVKGPAWRPQFPKQSSQFGAHFSESDAPPFGLKIVLIPKAALLFGIDRLLRQRDVLDLITGAADKAVNTLGPNRCNDAGRPAAP